MWMASWIGVVVGSLAASAAFAETPALQGTDIISLFQGQTVVGTYADGTPVRETYAADGSILYWDPRGGASGTWSVSNNLFCTFYEGLAGGCFRVERLGENCFDFLVAADTAEEARNPTGKTRYVARAAIKGRPATCPEELQV